METKVISENIAKQKIVVLNRYEEAVGPLHHLDENDELLTARIADNIVSLPSEMKSELSRLLGCRVAIIRTDIPQKEYILRILDDRDELQPLCFP